MHPLIETLKISLKLTFSLPTLNCPNHDKILPCQTTIICIYVFFPHGVELDYFSPSKKSSQHYTWPDSGTYNEASGNVVQQGHISIPSLSVVKEFFSIIFSTIITQWEIASASKLLPNEYMQPFMTEWLVVECRL